MIVIEKIINEDGTDYDPPKNPLSEKWNRLYPGCKTDGYKCMFCGDCPYGEYWKVPEEDRDVFITYLQAFNQYNIEHGNEFLPKIILKKETPDASIQSET